MDAPHLDALLSIRATHLCHDKVCRRRVRILLWVSALAIILYCSILQEQEQSRKPVGQHETVHILMFFAKAEKNDQLQQQLRANIRSLVKHATGRIKYHFLGDANSTRIAADILENVFDTIPHGEDLVIQVQTYEVESVVAKVGHDVWPIQQLFKSYRKKYNLFNDIFYFIPFALHKVIDLSEVDRIIKVDADMRLMNDIRKLWREFDEFKEETIFALAQEQQPVYYQRFAKAREAVGDDRLGMPPPSGKPGYNGGLYLINLDHMSKSKKYQAAVSERNLRYIMRKYYFTKSHLGDQEVVTILGMEYPELFHTLPCTWNRQLCRKYARSITMPSA
ncbi:PREDICTED: xyloside xylosyltransferase 1-like [Priapulus caudatus]|uniref:Xyloside xylosyltransferase 1-like n=1 Tax=Priapulus caudatus TaxID=37621 RepID=A0ABM1F0M2_PRICU|nr:PREDICTED: xyloside xylosyltransferase 1-like [Priapulus caudatus]